MAKVRKARAIRGTRFLHLLSPCPTGWKMGEDMSPRVSAAAVKTNIFPLYEIVDGIHYEMSYLPKALPVEAYLSLQGRFKHLKPEEIKSIQEETDRAWARLLRKAEADR